MLADLLGWQFLEVAESIHRQQVSGISISRAQKPKLEHKIAITDVDINGIHNIVRAKHDTIVIMVPPPSFERSGSAE